MERDLALNHPHDEIRFQVSLLRLVYHGSLDGGPGYEAGERAGQGDGQLVSRQIAEIEHLIEQ